MDKAKGFVLHLHVWSRAVTAASGCCTFKDKKLKGAGHTSAQLRIFKGMIVVATDGVGGVLCSLPVYNMEFIVPCLTNFCNKGGGE
eukprot:958350-Pelagomonas_calceolata.AAC.1